MSSRFVDVDSGGMPISPTWWLPLVPSLSPVRNIFLLDVPIAILCSPPYSTVDGMNAPTYFGCVAIRLNSPWGTPTSPESPPVLPPVLPPWLEAPLECVAPPSERVLPSPGLESPHATGTSVPTNPTPRSTRTPIRFMGVISVVNGINPRRAADPDIPDHR